MDYIRALTNVFLFYSLNIFSVNTTMIVTMMKKMTMMKTKRNQFDLFNEVVESL